MTDPRESLARAVHKAMTDQEGLGDRPELWLELADRLIDAGVRFGPPLSDRERAEGHHMPRPTDVCVVCGNGLIHVDSWRDIAGQSDSIFDVDEATGVLLRAGVYRPTDRGFALARGLAVDVLLTAVTGERYDLDDDHLTPEQHKRRARLLE